MLELSLHIDADDFKVELERAQAAIEALKVDGMTVNGALLNEHGTVIKYVINGSLATQLFLLGNKEVSDGNNGHNQSEEFTQLDFSSIANLHSGDCCAGTGEPTPSDSQRSCCSEARIRSMDSKELPG